MTSNGSTYSQSVRPCIPILNRDPQLITGSVFELVSAYGTVGLSLGIPDVGHIHAYLVFIIRWSTFQQNYSLSGEFNTLTKLIFCLVMIRGRHRGLPAAIDRAVMLPAKLQQTDDLIRENRSQPSIDEGVRATSCGASTPPINSSLRASSVYQRVRTTSRRFDATNVWISMMRRFGLGESEWTGQLEMRS
jgi:hypothetical protein